MQYYVKERFITVTDDWYPCYEGNKVKLRLTLTSFLNKYYVKFAAWGADDTAYEVEYEFSTLELAKKKYQELIYEYEIVPDNIDKYWFIDRGFKRF